MSDGGHADLHRRGLKRRWRPTEERMQLAAELTILVEETRNYDTLLEQAAPAIARHVDGGCVIALLADDGKVLHPLGIHHDDPDASQALDRLTGLTFQPLGISRAVMEEGRGRRIELAPEMFAERPGVVRYLEITGHDQAIVVPMRNLGRSTGVLWLAAARAFDDDDVNFVSACASRLALAVHLLRYVEGDVAPARREEDGPVAALTAREREILAMVAEGLTSREVAERLVVSVRTVEWHRARLQAKLGVSGRSKLTSIAREAGLAPPVP